MWHSSINGTLSKTSLSVPDNEQIQAYLTTELHVLLRQGCSIVDAVNGLDALCVLLSLNQLTQTWFLLNCDKVVTELTVLI